MNDIPRQKLRELLQTYGNILSEDPRRCKNLLLDLCGEYRREISVLISAQEERVAADLLASSSNTPYEVLVTRLSKRLYENRGMAEDFARWGIESWAWALGLRSNQQVAVHPSSASKPVQQIIVVAQSGRGQYRSISEAIKASQPHTRILVQPGVYREGLILDKELEIIGDGPREQIIVESSQSYCLLMQTEHALVRGMTLHGRAGQANKEYYAVYIPQGRLELLDCDITSDSLACVAIRGATANPLLCGCKLHDGKYDGLFVSENGRGIVEDCDIFANAGAGVTIATGGNPVVRRCKLHDGKSGGLFVYEHGRGTVEDCDIFANTLAGAEITRGGDPIVRRCTLHDGKGTGLTVYENGRGTIEDCDIFANARVGVLIMQGSDPVVRRCTLHHGFGGLLVCDNGRGTIENCDIFANAHAEVAIAEGGNPVVRKCRLHNGESGLIVSEQGRGTIEDCDIFANAAGGVLIMQGSDPVVRRCTLHDAKFAGLAVSENGRGTVEDCNIFANAGPGVGIARGGNPVVRRCRINQNSYHAIYVSKQGQGTVEDCDLTANAGGAWKIAFLCKVQRRGNKE